MAGNLSQFVEYVADYISDRLFKRYCQFCAALSDTNTARARGGDWTEALVTSGDFPFRAASLTIIFEVFPVRSYRIICLQSQGAVATLLVTASI